MAQQSTTEPREAPRNQGRKTREQHRRILERKERTDGADLAPTDESLAEAEQRHPGPGANEAYDLSDGDRAIQRGAHDRGDHHKTRPSD